MTERDPRILPGITAYGAERRFALAVGLSTLIWIVVFAASCVIGGLLHLPDRSLLAGVGIILGLNFVVALAGVAVSWRAFLAERRTRHAELVAGYTTLLTQFDQVDGIDPRTGLVVRPAKVHAAPATGADSFGTGLSLGPLTPTHASVGVILGQRGLIIAFVASLVATIVIFGALFGPYGDNASDGTDQLLVIAGSLSFVAVIVFLTYVIVLGPERFYGRFLREHFVGDRVFATQTTGDLADVVGELLAPDVAALPGARPRLTCYLVFGRDEVTILSRLHHDLLPFLVIPRSRITSTRMDVNTESRGPNIPVVVLVVQKDDGSSLDVRLQFLPEHSVAGGKVLSELNADNEWVANWAAGKASSVATEKT